MFLLIDNYDSFTYNLFHYLGEVGAQVEVRRNDVLSVDEALDMNPTGIVISPGPCDPDRAGISVDLIRSAAGHVPILGVCLGHQSIGQAFDGRVVRAPTPMHGKVSAITHRGTAVFAGIPSPLSGNRYHSLMVDRDSLPACLRITAESDDGVIQGLEHSEYPIFGVQFHPESIATEHGHKLLQNFLSIAVHSRSAQ
jgi:anthranilate synthase component 2